jgi:alanine racemase
MVRIGIGMYGISSNPQLQRKLEPVLSWNSVVSQVKTIEKGQGVGYNRAFIATKPTKVATIPIGYADGFKRSLSNGKGYVFIQGKKCVTLGKVCMDMIMVDVSAIEVKVGEAVEIIGPNISLEEMALLQDTIPYEIMTSISSRVHRVYVE